MTLRRLCLALLLLLPLPAAAQDLFPQGRLWRIEAPGVASSYLFGTMHSSDPDILRLPPAVKQAFSDSDNFVLEVVIDPAEVIRALGKEVLPPPQTLRDLVTPATYAAVQAALQAQGLPQGFADRFEPWVAVILISQDPAEMARMRQGAKPLDMVLQELATRSGKSVTGIETLDEQFSIFSGMSRAQQIETLEIAAAQPELLGGVTEMLKRDYLAGDQRALWDNSMALFDALPPDLRTYFLRELLVLRNHRMAERLQPVFAAGDAFVAVGALHLPSEEGLLNLLSAQGFTVSPAD